MARPKAKELTQRELEIMQQFWESGDLTIADVQERLSKQGRKLAYTTVATLVRILCEKNFVKQLGQQRPFVFRPRRSFQDVSGRLVKDLIQRVFGGSREALLVRLMEEETLSESERHAIAQYLHADEKKNIT